MKIPNNLSQFKDERVFLIVAGRQDAAFYMASNGEIARIDAFKIPTPRYSDHEGEFKGNGIWSAGSGRELRHENIIRDFIREFIKRIKNVTGISQIYISAPAQTKNRIVRALPTVWQKMVQGVIAGNYFYHHPLLVVQKISESERYYQ